MIIINKNVNSHRIFQTHNNSGDMMLCECKTGVTMTKITIKDLLDAGIHFGHKKIDGTQKCLNTYLDTEMAFI